MSKTLKGLLISNFTIDVLGSYLQNLPQAPLCEITILPFAQSLQALIDPDSPYWNENYDFHFLWFQPDAICPSFKKLMAFELTDYNKIRDEFLSFNEIIKARSAKCKCLLVATFTLPPYLRGLGLMDYKEQGVHYWLLELNHMLVEETKDLPNVFVMDASRWINLIGGQAFNEKLWYMSKVPYDYSVFKIASQEIKSALAALKGGTKKLIILDLDQTLWGGIIGEVGIENINLGGHDPVGEAFVDFQRQLKNFKNRGILLAIVSKNDEQVALKAIREHPEMVLRESDFVCMRINWQDKAQNIVAILEEINLTATACVFIDDSAFERERVGKALPDVLVPDWPRDSLLFKKTLLSLPYFDTVQFGAEDKKRTELYSKEKKRQELKQKVPSLNDWLRSLKIVVTIESLADINLARATQLINKTNQLNLTTRRLVESEFLAWSKNDAHHVWTFRVADNIGDSGLVGVVSVLKEDNQIQIIDFLLSCRVFGRKIEHAMLAKAMSFAEKQNCKLFAKYKLTEKSKPTIEFLKQSGLREESSGKFFGTPSAVFSYPDHLEIKDLSK